MEFKGFRAFDNSIQPLRAAHQLDNGDCMFLIIDNAALANQSFNDYREEGIYFLPENVKDGEIYYMDGWNEDWSLLEKDNMIIQFYLKYMKDS